MEYITDALPVGSYLITPEFLFYEDENLQNDDLEAAGAAAIHSPYLLSIGKALIPIADLLSRLENQNCQAETCSLPHFDSKLLRPVSNTQIFEALRIPEALQLIKYTVFKRTKPLIQDLEAIASYEIDVVSFVVKTNDTTTKLNPCVQQEIICRDCVNLWQADDNLTSIDTKSKIAVREKNYLKSDLWVLVFLILIACGTTVCLAVGAYILFRYLVDDIMDGNPILTFLLMLGIISLFHSVIPFCLDENIFGHEQLNAKKIYFSTLSIGFVLSIMVSRSFFLALSTGGMFTSHINGYLQGLMVFFVFGVQLGMSTMYLAASTADSSDVLRSPIYIALLSKNFCDYLDF